MLLDMIQGQVKDTASLAGKAAFRLRVHESKSSARDFARGRR